MTKMPREGFTLIELLVVIAMIALLAGAVSSGVMKAQSRAKIARATAETREITNAILAYENYDRNRTLKTMADERATRSSLGFILGEGGNTEGEKVPVLYNAAVAASGEILDPWGRAYRVTIQPASGLSSADTVDKTADQMSTTLYFPNHARLSPEERSQ